MKFALVNGEKTEATKGAKGLCTSCGAELIAKCGEVNINHWAHKGKRDCDPWWENETEWHRAWKNEFPTEWQEVVHYDENGEKHIADVKTQTDWVIEFQHSYLKPKERRSRDAFYSKLIWVVDGARRKTDIPKFNEALKEGLLLAPHPPFQIAMIHFPDECRIIRDWRNSTAPVLFDFPQVNGAEHPMLRLLFPRISDSVAYICSFPRNLFIDFHNKNEFDQVFNKIILPFRNELIALDNRKKQRHY